MRLSENIKRIREVMGLISEQETYTFTDKSEYEKALKIYNQAKKLSDESIRKFNAFKNSKFYYYVGGEVYKDNWVARLHQQYDKLIKDKKLLDDRYLISQSEKPDAIIKPVRNWCTAWLTKRPTDGSSSIPEKDTEFIPLTASAKYPQNPSPRQYHDYDHEKYSWWGHICGTIYEPTMPEPILQTKHQIQPNFQSPPIKISSTPSGVLPIMQQPFEPNTPEKTKFMISWTPDGKCRMMKYYDTFEDMQKEVRDFDLPFLGSRTEGKPPNYAEYKTEKIQGKSFPEGPWFNSCTQKWDENLNENKDKIKIISEQTDTENVYIDEESYKKALENYNKAIQIYRIYLHNRNIRKKFDETIIKKYPERKLRFKPRRFKNASDISDPYEPMISWGKLIMVKDPEMITGYHLESEKDYSVSQWNSKHKNDPIKPIYFEGSGGHYYPVYQEPIKPVLKKPNPEIKKDEIKVSEPIKTQKPEPKIDGDAVYGPGNSLIGFIKDRKFIPVSDPSMMPNKNNYFNKWDWDLLQDKEKMKEFLYNKFGSYVIYESMKVDDWGRLHDDDSKIVYPYSRIAKFVTWFDKEFGDYAAKQGWFIVSSDSDAPKIRYKPEDGNKFNLFFQVQRIDDPMEGEALFGRLKNDHEADELAKKLGLVLDEYGVVIGWENEIFI